jgi:hypothetical protein
LVSGLFFVALPNFGVVHASTEITGVISSDVTWSEAGSPYNITGPVLVSKGVTLTIEAGVTVSFNDYDYYIQVSGTLIARGSNTKPICFVNGSSIRFTQDSVDWNEQTNTGSIIERAVFTDMGVRVDGAPKISDNTILGLVGISGGTPLIKNNEIDGRIFVTGGAPIIVNNTLLGNAGSDWIGRPVYDDYGISLSGNNNAVVADNFIFGDFTQAAIEIESGTPTIERNLVSNRYGYSSDDYSQSAIGIWRDANPLIQNNTLTKSARGISCNSPTATIIYNNIYGNKNYNIYLNSHATNNINARNNWWGTTNTTIISQKISDFEEDFNLGTVEFTPFLVDWNPQAALIPSEIDVYADASSTELGSLRIHCMITDFIKCVLENKTITMSYSETGNSWNIIGSETCSPYDCFFNWTNTDSGTFLLKAEWNGDQKHSTTTSITTLTCLNYQDQNLFFVQSPNKVSDLIFNITNSELTFDVTEGATTSGYIRVTIPKDLLSSDRDWQVLADGKPIHTTSQEDEHKTYLQFKPAADAKTIQIIGTTTIPEFPSWTLLPILLGITSVVLLYKKQLAKRQTSN